MMTSMEDQISKFDYEFSVAKLVVNGVRFEPVNIGVLLLDKTNKILYSRYITNFDELLKRTNVKNLGGLEMLLKTYPRVHRNINIDVLNKLHNPIDHDSIMFSKPKPVSIKNVDKDFETLFDTVISIKDANAVK